MGNLSRGDNREFDKSHNYSESIHDGDRGSDLYYVREKRPLNCASILPEKGRAYPEWPEIVDIQPIMMPTYQQIPWKLKKKAGPITAKVFPEKI